MGEKLTYIGRWLRDAWGIFVNELRMISRDGGVMLIFCFAGLVYPVLYNWIYEDGVVNEKPEPVDLLEQHLEVVGDIVADTPKGACTVDRFGRTLVEPYAFMNALVASWKGLKS